MVNRAGVEYDEARTKDIYAEDFNLDRDEIVAIETILGTNPEGDFDTVVERLDDIDVVHAFSAKSSAATALTNNAYTKLVRATELYDKNDEYDAANSKFVCQKAGVYHFDAEFFADNYAWTVGDRMALVLYKNGELSEVIGQTMRFPATVTSYFTASLHGDLELDVDDYVELYINFYRTGGNISQYSATGNYFSGHRVG